MTAPNHFLDLHEFDGATLRGILSNASARKEKRRGMSRGTADIDRPLDGKTLAMIFEKPSTRTRVSFEMAMRQLGGDTLYLNGNDMQLGRGETVADTARVLSRYVDAVMIRTTRHDILTELAANATVPVINGLTDRSHPCQVLADVMTYEEHRGPIKGRSVAWAGDGNNVAMTWIHAAVRFGFGLKLACPQERAPSAEVIAWAKAQGGDVVVVERPDDAVKNADCVVTDVWLSMSEEAGENGAALRGRRHNLLAPYQVNDRLMGLAKSDALFMHCLPAHRGDEVTASVIDGPQSVVWDEAENRLHAQKGILTWCFG